MHLCFTIALTSSYLFLLNMLPFFFLIYYTNYGFLYNYRKPTSELYVVISRVMEAIQKMSIEKTSVFVKFRIKTFINNYECHHICFYKFLCFAYYTKIFNQCVRDTTVLKEDIEISQPV